MPNCYCTAPLRADGSCPYRCDPARRKPHQAHQKAARRARRAARDAQGAPVTLADVRALRDRTRAGFDQLAGEVAAFKRCSRCGNRGHVRAECGDRRAAK
jgi:hypothetical protein